MGKSTSPSLPPRMSELPSLFPAPGPRLGTFLWPRALAWTGCVALLAGLGILGAGLEQKRMALRQIRASFQKDQAYRGWVADRGGVYVPRDGRTPPDPHLSQLPDRDVTTTDGKALTLVNPAYLTRMIHEAGRERLGLQAKITSERPIRPENAPDAWEAEALRQIAATGSPEYAGVQVVDGRPYLRFLGALTVGNGCLRCHGDQGYRLGELRGGLSLAMPLEPLSRIHRLPGMTALLVGLAGLWGAGLAGLLVWGRHGARLVRLKSEAEADRIGAEQYRGILQTSVDGYLHLDASGRILDVNEGYLRLSGYTRGEVLGLRLQDLEAEPQEPGTEGFLRRTATTAGDRKVSRHRAKDGRTWIVEASLSPVQGGRTWVAFLRDMTREYQARQALEESEQRLLNAQRIAHIGFWERPLDSDRLTCSAETFHIFGLPPRPDGLLTLAEVKALAHPEDLDKLAEMFEKIPVGGKPFRGEVRILRPDGSLRYLSTQAEVLLGRGGEGLRVIRTLFDVTEQREAEREKRQLEAEVQHAQKLESLGLLAGGVAHDMNNVLGAIFMVASGLQEQRPEDEALMRSMDLVMSAAGRGRDLVRGLTAFGRKGVEEPAPVDLNELVQREVDLLRQTTLQKLEIIGDLAPGLPRVLGDASALANALMNLCVNAVDAMPEGGQLRLATRLLPEGRVALHVEDTGVGMLPEVLQRATEPFYTTKPQGKGTGLGLAMVYGVAKAHGGTLDIRSQVGEGTTITLTFPALGAQAEAAQAGASKPAVAGPLRVLLVDDDDLIRSSVPDMLESLGHEVDSVASGLEAIHRLERGRPYDVVLLDMNMPGLNGLETLARLRLLDPDLPVIISSGYLEGEVESLLLGDPAISFLAKPFSLQELQKKLDRRAGRGRGRR